MRLMQWRAVNPTFFANSTLVIRPSSCNSARICRSISSMLEAAMKRQTPFQLMRGSIIMFQGNAIVPLCDGRKHHLSISSDDAYAGNLQIDSDRSEERRVGKDCVSTF